jgi:hypothetical protein
VEYLPSAAANSNRWSPQFPSISVRGTEGDFFVRASELARQGLPFTANDSFSHSTDNARLPLTDGASNADAGGVAYFDP